MPIASPTGVAAAARARSQIRSGFLTPTPPVSKGILATSTPANAGAGGYGTSTGYGGFSMGGADPYGINSGWDSILKAYTGSLAAMPNPASFAQSSTNAQINAALAGYNAISQAQQAQYSNQQRRAQAFALALGQYAQPTADATQAAYNNAAHEIAGLGSGLSGAVGQAQQQAADQTQAAVQNMTGGQGQMVGTYNPQDARSVDQYVGATAPATTLEDQAANAAALAHANTFATTEQVKDVADQYGQMSRQALMDLAAQKTSLLAQRPSMYMQAYSDAVGNRQKALADLANVIGSRASSLMSQAQLGVQENYLANQTGKLQGRDANGNLLPGYQYDPKTGATIPPGYGIDPKSGNIVPTTYIAQTARTAATQAGRQSSDAARWTTVNGFRSDANGNPIKVNGKVQPIAGYKLTPDGQNVVKTGSAAAGQFSSGLQKQATSLVDQFYNGVAPHYHARTVKDPKTGKTYTAWDAVPGTGSQAVLYPEALRRLTALKPGDAAWKSYVTALLNSRYQEGEGGRPYSPQTSAALRRIGGAAQSAGDQTLAGIQGLF